MTAPIYLMPAWEAGLTADDKRLLEQMSGEESQFFRLYIAGEPRANHSPSEADFELALMAARHTRDVAQIQRLMETSPLARTGNGRDAKWSKHRTYLDRTIAAALRRENDLQFLGHEMKRKGLIGAGALEEGAERPRSRSLAEILKDPNATQAPTAVVTGLAWAGRITLVAAREGVGKSTLFSAAAAAVTQGGVFLGAPCPQGSVLWVLVEEHLNDLVIRALRFESGEGDLHVLERPDEPLTALAAEVERLRPALVIVDTLHSWAAPLVKDKSKSDDWHVVMRALQAIARAPNGPAVLMAAEAVKATGDYKESTTIGHGVDVVLNLVRPDKDSPVRRLERQKARWDLADLHVELVGDQYQRTSAKAMGDSRRTDVHAALTTEWQTVDQITQRLPGRKRRGVQKDLTALHAAGAAGRSGTGRKGDPFVFQILAQDAGTLCLTAQACGPALIQNAGLLANAGIGQKPVSNEDSCPF